MAITVPRLQKLNTSSEIPSNERIKMNVENNASNILNTTNAVSNLAEKGIDLYTEFENDKITQLSYEVEKEYSDWNGEKLAKLKAHQGDPTELYAQYEQEAEQKYNEILNKRPDLNTRVKSGVKSALDKTANTQRIQVLKQRGAQQEVYENNTYESAVKLKKNNLGVSASYIKADDPGSFYPFEENIADIKTTIAKRAIDKGLGTVVPENSEERGDHVYRDLDGKMVKVKLNDIAKVRVAKELSEGVGTSITSMINSGYTQEAQAAFERYKPYLDTKTKGSIESKFKTTGLKSTAYDEMSKIEGKSESEQMQYIESVKDPEIKSELLKIKDTNDRRRQNIRERREKVNYEALAGKVLNRMNSEAPYNGLAELEEDPTYKAVFDRLDAKSKKSIIEMVNAPKETNSKSEVKIQDLFFGNDADNSIEEISPEQFAQYTTGLSRSDKKKYTNMYNRMRTQTSSEERSTYKRAGNMLRDQLLIDEHIEKDKFGKISGDDEITLLKAQNKLIDHLDKQGVMDEKSLKDFVKNFSAAEIKGKVFSPEPKAVFSGSAKPRVTSNVSTAPSKTKELVISPKDLIAYKKQFRELNGYFPTTKDVKFKTFLEKNR